MVRYLELVLQHMLRMLWRCSGWRPKVEGHRYLSILSPLTRVRRYAQEVRERNCATFRSFCPCCWRPLQLRLGHKAWVDRAAAVGDNPKLKNRAYVVVVWGDSLDYAVGASVLGQSILDTKTKHDLVCLVTPDVPRLHRELLKQTWEMKQVDHIESVPELFNGEKDPSRFKHVFTKLQILSLTEYEKILFLDSDVLVASNIDDLFDLPAPAAMRRGMNMNTSYRHGDKIDAKYFFTGDDEVEWQWAHSAGINAGVLLLEPNWNVFCRMKYEVACASHPAHIRSNGPEQDYLSRFYADAPWTHIGVECNFQLHQLYNAMNPLVSGDAERTTLLGADGKFESIRVIHYSGELKPWHRHLGKLSVANTTAENFVELLLQRMNSWQLFVKKDPKLWENMEGEKFKLGGDGQLRWKSDDSVVLDDTNLHRKAKEFVVYVHKKWDDVWKIVSDKFDSDLQSQVTWYGNRVKCDCCGEMMQIRVKCHCCSDNYQIRNNIDWCDECWWSYQPTSGNRIAVSTTTTSASVLFNGEMLDIKPPIERRWLVCLFLDTSSREFLEPLWVQPEEGHKFDLEKFGRKLEEVYRGCLVVVAFRCRREEDDEVWKTLAAIGGPETVNNLPDHEFVVASMIGIKAQRTGNAILNCGIDVACASRRIKANFSHDRLPTNRGSSGKICGQTVSTVVAPEKRFCQSPQGLDQAALDQVDSQSSTAPDSPKGLGQAENQSTAGSSQGSSDSPRARSRFYSADSNTQENVGASKPQVACSAFSFE